MHSVQQPVQAQPVGYSNRNVSICQLKEEKEESNDVIVNESEKIADEHRTISDSDMTSNLIGV
jgi:hypothetical protein